MTQSDLQSVYGLLSVDELVQLQSVTVIRIFAKTSEESSHKKRKTWYAQSFKDEWLQLDDFKEWLQKDTDNKDNSYCKCGRVTLKNAIKSMLLTHKNTDKHNKNFDAVKSNVSIDNFLRKRTTPESETLANSEALLAGFFLSITSHLPLLITCLMFAKEFSLIVILRKN